MTAAAARREGLALLEGAILDARAHGQHLAALRGTNNHASATIDTDPRASLEQTREGMALARRLGLLSFDSYHAGNGAQAAERLGEWAWAREALGALVEAHPDGLEAECIASGSEYHTAWTGGARSRADGTLARPRHRRERPADGPEHEQLARRCAFAAGRPADALRLSKPFLTNSSRTRASPSSYPRPGTRSTPASSTSRARSIGAAQTDQVGRDVDHDRPDVRAGVAALEGRGSADALSRQFARRLAAASRSRLPVRCRR